MTVKIQNSNQVSNRDFLLQYTQEVEKIDTLKQDVLELSELMAKHPADVFIISNFEDDDPSAEAIQGDILIWRKGSRQYNRYIDSLRDLKVTESRNLQLSESITGDHKVVPLKNSKLTIKNGTITVDVNGFRPLSYPVKMIKASAPFCVVHSEHGNITLPAGEYMSCVSLDPKTLHRMED